MVLDRLVPDAFRSWLEFATKLGFVDFLSSEDGFRTSLLSGEPWASNKACGVYFWIAENGETYVGETLSSRGRLMDHLRGHPDMRFACFQPTLPEARKAREQELIRQIREVFPTRNIKHALSTRAFVPFDQFISPPEREAFLRSDVIEDDQDEWQELPLLTQKQRGRFHKFSGIPERDKILEGILLFVWSVIPRPRLLENRFWSITLFPAHHIVRVNVGQQEVFTIFKSTDRELIARAFTLQSSGPEAEGPMYKSGSYVDWFPLEDLSAWLLDENRLWSCRELAIQLMRHTTALNNGSHCPQVVRAAWEWHKTNPTPPLSEGQKA